MFWRKGRGMKTTPDQSTSTARLWAGIIAVLAFCALAVQPLLGEGSYLANLGAMLRFFTIWGNVGACVVMAAIALGRHVPRGVMAALDHQPVSPYDYPCGWRFVVAALRPALTHYRQADPCDYGAATHLWSLCLCAG